MRAGNSWQIPIESCNARRFIPITAPWPVCRLPADPPDVFAFVQKSCGGCHNATVKSGDVIWRRCTRRRHSKRIARFGRRWSKSSNSGRCRLPVCRGRDAKRPRPIARWLESEFARQDRAPQARARTCGRPPAQSSRVQQHDPRSSASTFVPRTTFRRTRRPTVSTTSATR